MKRKLARFVMAFLSCQLIILACSREGVDENLDYESLSALDGDPVTVLKQLVDLLESVYGKLPFNSGEGNPSLLISSISFHKSIINTAATSIAQNSECECTVHPFFLTGKTHFNCQEEHFYEAARLAESVNRLLQEDSADDFGLKAKELFGGK